MNRFHWQAILGLAVVLAATSGVHAQRTLQDPHIGYLYPAGGRAGTTFQVLVGGQFLAGTTDVFISGGGARVAVVKYYKHLSRGEYMGLNRKIRDTREKLEEERKEKKIKAKITEAEVHKLAGITEADLERMADYRRREADPKRQFNPQLMEEITIDVKLSPDAKFGERELRLVSAAGMSNPMFFQVGQFREVKETEPNDQKPDYVIGAGLPVTVNGQIMPGDVDRFSFQVPKGTKLVAMAGARELIPYLADAVPGWFQAVLALYDAKGKEVAYASAFGFNQDPVLYYDVPQDGEYVIEIRDAIFRGREDFVYRLTLGELPIVTSVYPLGGRAGTQLTVDVKGWNLPVDQVKMEPYYDRGRPIRSLFTKKNDKDRVIYNRVPFAVDMLPEISDQEPNNTVESAQAVTLPVIVNGRIDVPDDRDVFSFEGHAKEHLVAEVYARRLGSPLDSLLRLTDAAGKEVAFNDDYEDKGLALATHHADSRITTILPANGTYYLHLTDAQRKGGPEFAYRLQIRPPRPDFELRVVPSSIIARPGVTVPVTVFALRRDGFNDDIMLELEGAPAGFKLNGNWVPGGQDKSRMTLTVPTTATPEPVSLTLEGRVTSHGRRVVRVAIPAEAQTQAFAYQHLVPANDWTVMVTGKGAVKPAVVIKQDRFRISAGGTTQLLAATPGKSGTDLRMELNEPIDGITIQSVTPLGEGATILVATDGKKIKPGLKGNLIFNAFSEKVFVNADGKAGKPSRTALGMLPAIPFEVVK